MTYIYYITYSLVYTRINTNDIINLSFIAELAYNNQT